MRLALMKMLFLALEIMKWMATFFVLGLSAAVAWGLVKAGWNLIP